MSTIYNNAIKRRENIITEYSKELERLTKTVEWYEQQIIKHEQEIQTLNEIAHKETTKPRKINKTAEQITIEALAVNRY